MSPIYCQTKKRKMFMTVNTYTYTIIVCFLLCFVQHSRHTDGVRIMKRETNKKKKKRKTYLSVDRICVKDNKTNVRKKIFLPSIFILLQFSYDHHHSKKK